jgi:hypothetical protein
VLRHLRTISINAGGLAPCSTHGFREIRVLVPCSMSRKAWVCRDVPGGTQEDQGDHPLDRDHTHQDQIQLDPKITIADQELVHVPGLLDTWAYPGCETPPVWLQKSR